MHRAWPVALIALFALPMANAGSSANPEITDDAGDKASSIPGLGATSVEITKGWIASETPTEFTFKLDVGGDFTPDPTETLAYQWVVELEGNAYEFGAEVFQTATTTTTPTGIATAAAGESGIMTITVPRSAFTDIKPGQFMGNLMASATAYVVSPLVWNDSDSAVGSRSYTVGAQADESMDFDGDGVPDRQEIATGTDPTDPADPPAAIPPVVSSAFAGTGGAFDLSAETPIDETYSASWNNTLTQARLDYTASITQGSVTFLLQDGDILLMETTLTANITDNATFSTIAQGQWNLSVVATDFVGTFGLTIADAAPAATPDPADPGDDETPEAPAEPTDGDDGADSEPKKSTPFPAVAGLLVLGAAWARRR